MHYRPQPLRLGSRLRFPAPRRPLTAEERALAAEVFGPSLGLDAIRVTRDSIWSLGSAKALFQTVHLSSALGHFDDEPIRLSGSKDRVDLEVVGGDSPQEGTARGLLGAPTPPDASRRGELRTDGTAGNARRRVRAADGLRLSPEGTLTLIHELVHVWQYQHGGPAYIPESLWAQARAFARTGSRRGAYDWRTVRREGRPWARWNPEQQAAAIERWSLAFLRARAGRADPRDGAVMAGLMPVLAELRAGRGAPRRSLAGAICGAVAAAALVAGAGLPLGLGALSLGLSVAGAAAAGGLLGLGRLRA